MDAWLRRPASWSSTTTPCGAATAHQSPTTWAAVPVRGCRTPRGSPAPPAQISGPVSICKDTAPAEHVQMLRARPSAYQTSGGRTPGLPPRGVRPRLAPAFEQRRSRPDLRPPTRPLSLDLWHFIAESPVWSWRRGTRGADGATPPPSRATRPRGSTLGSTRRVAGTTSEDLRSEGYTDRGRARTRRGPGGLLRGFLSALGPRGCHPLGNRLLLFGRHRSALPRRLGVGRGLRDWGGRSRRPPRGGAPSRGLRRSGGPEHLVDVVQRLDFRLQALDLTLAVGDCLCYNTHKFSQGCIVRRSTRSRLRPSVFQWVPILAQREFGGQTEPAQSTLPFPTTRSSSVACGGAGRTERASVLRPTSTGGSPCPPPNPSRVGVVPATATAASLTSCSYGLTPAGDRPRSRYGSPRPHLVQEGIANVLVR